jgi:hypothetical protein
MNEQRKASFPVIFQSLPTDRYCTMRPKEITGMQEMTTSAPDLQCPHCGYNLACLPEPRCPECGQSFDHADLAGLAATAPKPIHGWLALLQLSGIAFGYIALACLLALVDMEAGFGTLMIGLVVISVVHASVLAPRILAARALRAGRPAYGILPRRRKVLLILGLFVLQVLIAIGGCYSFPGFYKAFR